MPHASAPYAVWRNTKKRKEGFGTTAISGVAKPRPQTVNGFRGTTLRLTTVLYIRSLSFCCRRSMIISCWDRNREMFVCRMLFPLLLLLHWPTRAHAFLFEASFDFPASCLFFPDYCDDGGGGATLSFQFEYIDNDQGDFAIRGLLNSDPLFQQNIRAATDIIAQVMDVSQDVTLNVRISADSNSARAI